MPDRSLGDLGMHQVALQEGIRSLENQTQEVGRIRDRTVSLVALTATASAFLVGAALESSTRGARFYIPLGLGTMLLVVLIGLSWFILRPVAGWRSKVSPTVMVENFADGVEGYVALAAFYVQAIESNEGKLDHLRVLMQRALLISGTVLLSWIALIWLVAS